MTHVMLKNRKKVSFLKLMTKNTFELATYLMWLPTTPLHHSLWQLSIQLQAKQNTDQKP